MAAAAYTGTLPGSMQRLAHDHLGAPRHHGPITHHPAASARQTPTQTALRSHGSSDDMAEPGLTAMTPAPTGAGSGSAARGSSVSGLRSQRYLLCTAYTTTRLHGTKAQTDAAMRELAKVAGGHDKVSGYCAQIWHATLYPSSPRPPGDPSAHPSVTTTPDTPNGQHPS